MGGICDLITSGVPPLRRAELDFADLPLVTPNAETLSHVSANLPASADRAAVRAAIRVPPAAPNPPPPARAPPDNENVQTPAVPSDYQSDWYGDWNYSNWKRKSNRYRSSRKQSIAPFFLDCASLQPMGRVGFDVRYFTSYPCGSFGSPLGQGHLSSGFLL